MRKVIAPFAAVVSALFATAALAYVMPAFSILKHMTDVRDDLQIFSWKIDGSLSFYGQTAKDAATALKLTSDSNELQVDGTISLKLPGRCRFDAINVDGTGVAAIMSNGKERQEGAAVKPMQVAIDQLCSLLANRSSQEGEARAAVERHLGKLGVNEKLTSLARFGNGTGASIAYVIGDPTDGKPSFWVYKESPPEPRFPPARLRFTQGSDNWDLKMFDYNSPDTGVAFPRVVELWKGNEMQLRFTVLKGEGKAQLADKLF